MSSEKTDKTEEVPDTSTKPDTEEEAVAGASSVVDSESKPSSGSSDTEEESESVVDEEELVVHSIMIDEYELGVRIVDQPLSEPIVFGLQAMGVSYLSRYQQALLDYLTRGEDWWIAANLSSSRGVFVGAYLADIALGSPEQTTVVMCIAVPKIREFFAKDLTQIAQYTDLKILVLDQPMKEGDQVEGTPNIIIAPIDAIATLDQFVDLTGLRVIYFDEMEKSVRDHGGLIGEVVQRIPVGQRIIQTSYFSKSLNPQIEMVLPGLAPYRFRKKYVKREWEVVITGDSWLKVSGRFMANHLLGRYLCVEPEDSINSTYETFLGQGIDVGMVNTHTDKRIVLKQLERLKDNHIQMLCMSAACLTGDFGDHFEVDVVVVTDQQFKESSDALKALQKKTRQLLVTECAEDAWKDQQTISIDEHCPFDQTLATSVLQSLRLKTMEESGNAWEGAVAEILASPDRDVMIGHLVRTYLQTQRAEVGYIHSKVYKLESKDLYQRRNKKRPRRNSRR